ncbi:MAG: hypothetical protein OEY14_16585, partial [Myxococcales bacterium]|nr:hypothetical protein [Myxococcales bacterium]
MARPRMRPRFSIDSERDVEALMASFREALDSGAGTVRGLAFRRHVELTTPDPRRRPWSPQLSLELKEGVEGGSQIEGRFGPHPNLWSTFMFLYGTIFMLGLCGGIFGLAQLALGHAPWALLSPLGAALMAAFVYGAALIGQGLGADEMYELRRFVDSCLEQRSGSEPAVE